MSKTFLLLNCIYNAQCSGYNFVVFDYSNNLYSILNILVEEGLLKGFLIKKKNKKKVFVILLKYKYDKPTIHKVDFNTKGSMSLKSRKLSKNLNGLGLSVVTTSQGIMTNDLAFYKNLGGKLLFNIR